MKTAVLVAAGFIVLLALLVDCGPSPAEKSRIYNDCLTRQIEAGSPNWATTVAICEDKRPQ